MVADRPSPTPSIVRTGTGGEAGRPGRRGSVRLVMIEDPQLGALQTVPRQLTAQREPAEEPRRRAGRPLGHAVFQPPASGAPARPAGPCAGAPRNSAPCSRATAGPASWPDRSSIAATTSICAGADPAAARQAAIDATGKAISSLRRRQPLFVDGGAKPAVLQQRGAGIVSVPDAQDVQLEEQVFEE